MAADITTTNGTIFTSSQSIDLARLVFLRFGCDRESAAAAWRRLLENSCTDDQFMGLVESPTHTPNCAGWCRDDGSDRY